MRLCLVTDLIFRVGLVTYGSNAGARFTLSASHSIPVIQSNINAAAYLNSGTATGRALNTAVNRLFIPSAGYRGSKAIVILISDGQTQETADILSAAVTNIKSYAEVYSIGVGGDANEAELRTIASEPTTAHVS